MATKMQSRRFFKISVNWTSSKTKVFCSAKDQVNRMKRQATDQVKLFLRYIANKKSYSGYIDSFQNAIVKKQRMQSLNRKRFEHFIREEVRMERGTWKDVWHYYSFREMQIKAMMRYHCPPKSKLLIISTQDKNMQRN